MSESALFVGWGQPVRGREKDGSIESFDPVLLNPHGGDLQEFFLIKGSAQGLATMMASDAAGEFA